MNLTNPVFTAVYCVKSSYKRNARIRTCYKDAPKKTATLAQAMCWFYDKVASRGKGDKQLVEMRQG